MQVTVPAAATNAVTLAGTGWRDPLQQPFASDSIWNMPIGSGAIYKPANLNPTPDSSEVADKDNWAPVPYADEEFIFLDSRAPLTPIYFSSWDVRCSKEKEDPMAYVPMPSGYFIEKSSHNNATAFLAPDNRTVVQLQPVSRCMENNIATASIRFPNVDLYGDGIMGAHGGSDLSALGGSIRVGELRPGQQGMRHALKIVVFAEEALYECKTRDDCRRWPADTPDLGSIGRYGILTHNQNVDMKMGALLAIPAWVDLTSLSLKTDAGKQIAWTLQNYGAYIVDTGGPGYAFGIEHSPAGTKTDEFKRDYGYDFMQKVADNVPRSKDSTKTPNPWFADMQKIIAALYVVSNNGPTSIGGGGTPLQPLAPPLRDPLKQPFASTSIWNMPIGANAQYVAANMSGTPGNSMYAPMPGVDNEKIFLTPTAPMTQLYFSDAGWSGGNRCTAKGGLLLTVPMPSDYVVPNGTGSNAAAFLMPDQRTIVQTQPLARCSPGGYGTSSATWPNVDLYGPGITGAHGGSGLSAIGGSIRIGELRPGTLEGPRHALKVEVFAAEALYKCTTISNCFRWPAVSADIGAAGRYGSATINQNSAVRMGALLAIPYSTSIASLNLETAVSKQLAWTLQNYGAYIVGDTGGPGFFLAVESGPAGDKRAEFQSDWGFPMAQKVVDNTPWRRDMQKLVQALYVVNNNAPATIGGGGTPRQPLAAPLPQ
jgi:hypothetical protein